MEEYKISIKNQVKHLGGISFFLFFILMWKGYSLQQNTYEKYDLNTYFLIMFSLQFIPLLVLHINYYATNRGDILKYDDDQKIFHFSHKKQQVSFSSEQIDKVFVYKSFSMQYQNVSYVTWDWYSHAVIVLQNGQKVTITSLMYGRDFKMPLPENKIVLKLSFVRWAIGPSLKL